MRITIIGKFKRLHDEEYIARSFESLGHEVQRIEQGHNWTTIAAEMNKFRPEVLLYSKWECPRELRSTLVTLNPKKVSWIFDLYFNYPREWQVDTRWFFKASDVVFSTDGRHGPQWTQKGIKHFCVRQGIYKPECWYRIDEPKYDVVFVGCDNPLYKERRVTMEKLAEKYNFEWFGRRDTNEMRGEQLNELYAKSKIIVGDSVYSPYYWSNRVVETLGRGGFLIHRDVPGLKEEYPDLVTYDGTFEDLTKKIDYYLEHEDERREIIRKNFEHVRDHYTMDKKCNELITWLNQ